MKVSAKLLASIAAMLLVVSPASARKSRNAASSVASTALLSTSTTASTTAPSSSPLFLDSYGSATGSTSSSSVVTSESMMRRGGDNVSSGLLFRLKITSYFALWYALNVVYNIVNKKVLNVLPLPLIVGSLQFGIGALYSSILWTTRLRTAPTLTKTGRRAVSEIGFYHMLGQLLSMVSLGAGPVSFTHIVKALEPFFSALVSALAFGKWMKPQVYATLIPVVGGVGYACLKEKSFSWLAFSTAMGSNLAFALRAVFSKTCMMDASSRGTQLTSANLFGLVTWAAFLLSIPLALFAEGSDLNDKWKTALSNTSGGQAELIQRLVVSGLFHYLNNEVMYLALSNVHPVTLAVGNTMKRVFIMVASVLVFRNPVSVQAAIGSAIGISGVLLYSLTKQRYELMEAQQESGGKRKKTAAVSTRNKKLASAGKR